MSSKQTEMPSLRTREDANPPRLPQPTAEDTKPDIRAAMFSCEHHGVVGTRRGRNLIVNIDGTSNQFSVKSTNVVELFSRIIKIGGDVEQLVFYNSGIGTYARPSFRSFGYWKQVIYNHIDTAIAWNFERIVHAAYKWLSENYQPGDRIFLFGFSRGAYQVRVIAGMIELVGLLHKGNENQIPFAYELYTAMTAYSKRESAPPTPGTPQKLSDEEQLCQSFKKSLCHEDVKVHFVGAWDTVSSIGVLRGKSLPETVSGMGHVCHFRHALALDERRAKFQPEYVNGGDGPTNGVRKGDVKEVWFKGTHSDIGGGNMSNKYLNNFGDSLRWMTYEARACGLLMTEYTGKWVSVELQESLTLGWVFLELLPFRALSYKGQDSVTWWPHLGRARRIRPGQRIHQSVFSASSSDSEVREKTAISRKISKVLAKRKTAAASYVPKAVLPKLSKHADRAAWEALFSEYQYHQSLGIATIDIEKDPFIEAAHTLTSLADVCLRLERGETDMSSFNTTLRTLWSFLNNDGTISVETQLAALAEFPDAGGILLTALGVAVHHQALAVVTPELKEMLIRLFSKTHRVSTTARLPAVSQVYQWGSKIRQYRNEFIKVLQPFACLWNLQADPYIFGVAFASADPLQIVFTTSHDATTSVLIWDGSTRPPKDVARDVQGGYSRMSRDGSHIAVVLGKDVSIIDTTAQPPSTTKYTDAKDPNNSGDIKSLCFSADNHTLATGDRNSWIKLWRWEGDQWKVVKRFKGGDTLIYRLAFSRDGSRLAFRSGPIKVWNSADDAVIELEDSRGSASLAWSPSGDRIVSGTWDGDVTIWSADRGKITHTFKPHNGTTQCLAFRDDGQVLATGSNDSRIRIWRCDTWEKILEFDIGESVWSLAFSPDGKRLVSGGYHGAVHLWDVDMGNEEPVD
ncbi:hypothetical protein ONZ45_g18180 [Pleurotus djamor]|nr:hypothetical protein ONZ45_g18180 [Pleurotus djamor]